jgi:hypothetical protein
MNIEYLFNPQEIIKTLTDYEFLKKKLKNPEKEGFKSKSFSNLRKTQREIYRILTNLHYEHLKTFLSNLNFCISHGWENPRLLQTRLEFEFDSLASELFVATHFAKSGYNISCFDHSKGKNIVPDLLASTDSISLAIEVYSPRDWDGLEYYFEDLRLSVLHLDLPYNFNFKIKSELIRHFDNNGMLLFFDPWDFSEVYSHKTVRSQRINTIVSEIMYKFKSNRKKILYVVKELNHNILLKLSIDEIFPAKENPERHGVILQPTLTGYSPEGMFLNLVDKRINSKISRRQTHSINDCQYSVLFVDVSNLGYISAFKNSYYQKNFAKNLIENLDKNKDYIDAVIFFQPNLIKHSTIDILLVFKQESISFNKIKDIIGHGIKFHELNKKVYISS